MPETLFGKVLFQLMYSAAFTTLILNGLEAWGYVSKKIQENPRKEVQNF